MIFCPRVCIGLYL